MHRSNIAHGWCEARDKSLSRVPPPVCAVVRGQEELGLRALPAGDPWCLKGLKLVVCGAMRYHTRAHLEKVIAGHSGVMHAQVGPT